MKGIVVHIEQSIPFLRSTTREYQLDWNTSYGGGRREKNQEEEDEVVEERNVLWYAI